MSSVIRAKDCSLMDTVSDVLQGKRITQEDKSRSKYSKIRKSEHEDQECLEWRHHLCAWDARIKLSIVIASLRVRQSLLQEIFLCNSFVMLVPSVAVCCFLVGFLGSFPCRIMCLGDTRVVRCSQALPWGQRMSTTLAALSAELLREGKAAGNYIFGRSG